MCVFREYAQLSQAITARIAQVFQAHTYRAGYGLGAISFLARIEGYEPLAVEPLVNARNGRWQRLAAFECTVEEPIDELQQQRPFTQPAGKRRQFAALGPYLLCGQSCCNQRQCLTIAHRIHALTDSVGGENIVVPRRD